ncbi:hypothetical protein I7I51_04429 [Histoplasma capsulatum]|uniref:Uncharacterized protein n=1 Tax=Ajellomyces capsulatus TaxID=5037 RepID=A0A8A1MCL8_AJECA|nr:hypothetical protein I7I51_04429 [Histoplasma capsulatum]
MRVGLPEVGAAGLYVLHGLDLGKVPKASTFTHLLGFSGELLYLPTKFPSLFKSQEEQEAYCSAVKIPFSIPRPRGCGGHLKGTIPFWFLMMGIKICLTAWRALVQTWMKARNWCNSRSLGLNKPVRSHLPRPTQRLQYDHWGQGGNLGLATVPNFLV